MADEHNRPIHETSPATAPHVPPDVAGDRAYEKCVACRQFHGGVNAGQRCLESEVRRLRACCAVLARELADLRLAMTLERQAKSDEPCPGTEPPNLRTVRPH